MSGHSKWSTIKHKKAKTDSARAAEFQKFSREIIVASKLGGGDPAGNFRLRTAIEKAKAAGLPNDNIKRAIEKGAGASGADNFEELTYKTTYSLPNNSYLIDISSDKIVYYNNGNIYINEEKTKDVDNIVPKGEYMQKYSSVSLKGKTKWLDAFLAYYNDKTYVRMDDYSDNLKEIY